MTGYALQEITRIVVIIHKGSTQLIAFDDRYGPDKLKEGLKTHKGAAIIYDGPPNRTPGEASV